MKNVVFVLLIVLSCRGDDDSMQRIDQIFNIYLKDNSGQDLLNRNKIGSYVSYTINDLQGETDNSPVSTASLKMTSDSLYYIEYIAGAKRVLDSAKSLNVEDQVYFSEMAFSFRRQVSAGVYDTINDLMRIEYRMTPSLFQVSKLYLNGKLTFSKEFGSANSINTVSIVK